MKFSDRYGFTSPREALLLDSISDEMRVRILNVIKRCVLDKIPEYFDELYPYSEDVKLHIAYLQNVWGNFFKMPLDEICEVDWNENKGKIKNEFFNLEWFEIYNLLEYLIKNHPRKDLFHSQLYPLFLAELNKVLEEEMSGYRVIEGALAPVTNSTEINSIKAAVNNSPENIARKFQKALDLLSKKPSPDCENSIKESITAIESMAKYVLGANNKTLGDLLMEMYKKDIISNLQMEGFKKLYGVSSKDGIRHGGSSNDKSVIVDRNYALYVLVTCSAFSNYLLSTNKAT